MNNLYGKLQYNLKMLINALSGRPCIVPAVLLFLSGLFCYMTSSFWPSLVLCIPVIVAAVCYALLKDTGVSRKVPMLLTTVLICGSLIYVGIYMDQRLGADPGEPGDNGFVCTVTDIRCNLAGDTDLTVRLEGGAYAVVSFLHEAGGMEEIGPGDSLNIAGELVLPDGAGNPGEFDYREYLRQQGILYVLNCDRLELLDKASFPLSIVALFGRKVFKVRTAVLDALTGYYDETYRAVTAAVCIGDKSLIDDDIKQSFEVSGCSHLLAVSGTHFAGFLACVPVILSVLKVKPKSAFVIHIAFCLLIGCLTGWSTSVTRAAVMSICLFADREWTSALSISAVIMILADPFCLMSAGFQISFCTVIAIKIYAGRIEVFLIKIGFGEKTAMMLSAPVSAMLGMIPFWSDLSIRPTPVYLVVQLIASYIAGIVCTCFVPSALLCLLLPFWSEYLSKPLLLCLKALMFAVTEGALLNDGAGVPFRPGKALLIMGEAVVFLFMLPPCMLKRYFLKISSLLLVSALCIELFSFAVKPACTVVFADVGQGDCCLIITPDSTCLIDAGTFDEGASTVSDLLDYYGIDKVDVCVMSHWDSDHAGGIAALYALNRVNTVMTPYIPEHIADADGQCDIGAGEKEVNDFFMASNLENDLNRGFLELVEPLKAGQCIQLSASVHLVILYPSDCINGGNDESLVAKLQVDSAGVSFLFTGDISSNTEEVLVASGYDIDCDVLKVAHHGSKYSSDISFIEACSPEIAVISVGRHNFYGHPSPDIIERLTGYGCRVLRTDEDGAVIFEY